LWRCSKKPAWARAHSHLYRTGPGREIPRVRFLLPISVKGGRLVDEALARTAVQ
jgi:hypothetical protein